MSTDLLVFGATGNLGRHVVDLALAAGHRVRVAVRNPARLDERWRDRLDVHTIDLAAASPAELARLMRGPQAMINTAGNVAEGPAFVALVDRLVGALETLAADARPVAWFLAGAALLALDDRGRLGVDLPVVGTRYGPHRQNLARLARTAIDWRLLCPGPMVDRPAVGLARLRVSMDRLPVAMPALTAVLPVAFALPAFAQRIPQLTVPYADAAALMLAHLAPGDLLSRHRVGLALPEGMRLHK
jgi:putative NADH-flavin reductase